MILWTFLLNTIQSYLLCHKLNYLMQWMTLIKFVFEMIVRESGLRTNHICNQIVALLWYCELICYYSFCSVNVCLLVTLFVFVIR